jgi:hypothetical protein
VSCSIGTVRRKSPDLFPSVESPRFREYCGVSFTAIGKVTELVVLKPCMCDLMRYDAVSVGF